MVEHDTARRQSASLYPPALHSTPIKHVIVFTFCNRDVLRLLPIENPHGHVRGDTTVVSPIHQLATHSSSPKIHIPHDKYRRNRGPDHQRYILSRINKALPGSMTSNSGMVDDPIA